MKKTFTLMLALFLSFAGYAQVTIILGSALLQNPGTDIHLPVSVKGLDGQNGGIGITGLELHINYTNSVLTYDTTVNFTALMPAGQWFYGASGTEYGTNWLEPLSHKVNVPDNTVLFEIVFHYLGGPTELTFDSVRCILADSSFNPIPGVHYVNAVVTPSQGSGDSRWNGTGSWNTLANWSNGIPGDSTNAIIESGTLSVQSYAVCKTLTVNPGSTVEISPDNALTVNRNYINNGAFHLLSDASGTGSLIVAGTASGAGVNEFRRYLGFSPGTAYFISSPVTGLTAAVFGSNLAEKYSESTASWMTMPSSDLLANGAGYRINGSTPTTLLFQGSIGTGDMTIGNLAYTQAGQAASRGLNLCGNPFPSAIQWDQGAWEKTNLDNAVYVWNGYKYVTWNGTIGSLRNGIIPAMQGFFVKSQAAGASLKIPSGSRLHSDIPYYKEAESVSNMISMKIFATSDTSHFDEAFVQVFTGSSTGFDGSFDAYKLTGNTAYPQIFTSASDQSMLAINTQPDFVSVPVEYTATVAGSYKITFSHLDSFDPGKPLFFEDKKEGTIINLRNTGEFVFSSDGSAETGRFILHFQEVGLQEMDMKLFSAWNAGNEIHIIPKTGISGLTGLDIFSMTGQMVFSSGALQLPATITLNKISYGLLIFRMKTEDGVYYQKMLVR